MSEYKKIDDSAEYLREYWEGASNSFARYFTYLQRGFGLVNEAKNYFLIVFGTIWTAKYITFMGYTINSMWILVAGVTGLPMLLLAGRWDLFKLSKSKEFAVTQHGSVIKYSGYNMSVTNIEQNDRIIQQNEETLILLKEINEKLKTK